MMINITWTSCSNGLGGSHN